MMWWWCFVSFVLFLLSFHKGWVLKERDKKRNPLFYSNSVRSLGTPFLHFGEIWRYWYFSLSKLASPCLAQMLLLGGAGIFLIPYASTHKNNRTGSEVKCGIPPPLLPILLLKHTLNTRMSVRRRERREKNMGEGGVRDILSHLIEYLRMTESMNKNSEPRERTEKSFRSSGRKVPSFFSSFPSPHHAHRSKQK